MRNFYGPSANYLRQQTTLALKALEPLSGLGPDVERQGLAAVIADCEDRLRLLPAMEKQTITPGDVGDVKDVQ